uniref:Uncharacterized protein n=1 Tax=Trichogramma kaykai TaxID=54128 RepID=A0ABD2WT41_9HYME
MDLKTTLQDGFKKCGLYPFGVEAIDMTKILNKTTNTTADIIPAASSINDLEIRNNQTQATEFTDHQKLMVFQSLLSSEQLKAFKTNASYHWYGPTKDESLYKIWYNLPQSQDNSQKDVESSSTSFQLNVQDNAGVNEIFQISHEPILGVGFENNTEIVFEYYVQVSNGLVSEEEPIIIKDRIETNNRTSDNQSEIANINLMPNIVSNKHTPLNLNNNTIIEPVVLSNKTVLAHCSISSALIAQTITQKSVIVTPSLDIIPVDNSNQSQLPLQNISNQNDSSIKKYFPYPKEQEL